MIGDQLSHYIVPAPEQLQATSTTKEQVHSAVPALRSAIIQCMFLTYCADGLAIVSCCIGTVSNDPCTRIRYLSSRRFAVWHMCSAFHSHAFFARGSSTGIDDLCWLFYAVSVSMVDGDAWLEACYSFVAAAVLLVFTNTVHNFCRIFGVTHSASIL